MKIAIQSQGRLREASEEFLRSQGLQFDPNGRKLINRCQNRDVEILYLRCIDIPEYVSRGAVDFGIVGKNILAEKSSRIQILQKLGFAKCRLVIAIPKNSAIKTIADLEGERIATSYPNLLTQFLKKQGVRSAIIPLRGSVEIAPKMNLADAICDLVQSGKTLAANHLKPLVTVMESEAVLIGNPEGATVGWSALVEGSTHLG